MKLRSLLLLPGVLCAALTSQAAVNLDRTRLIAYEADASVSLMVTNESSALPYLAHAWVEDAAGNKAASVFMALPPLQRLEPQANSQVKLVRQPGAAALPADRESLFYFNVREVPPKASQRNVMQMATQSRIKLFYRPAAIASLPAIPWQERIVVTRSAAALTLRNPTPYYITVGFVGNRRQPGIKAFGGMMVPPFGNASAAIDGTLHPAFLLGYINDHGALNMLAVDCAAGAPCRVTPDKGEGR
ncbi:fimbria/pilus periplasmic chaperone [Chimaeribacter arupi]|uniref:fimbria/pilus periplasmic chaperone n=1 Tax=Chimaeribacter arupi TaxID=2060066 RepID=UPI0027120A20|nr:fimbria/pilus periplasmic chaperone [Chimaeribacter arupi]WKZ93791.1 fimbria/pilus periplasmic chaperone [Chimaeribacter arupi]